MKIEKTQSVPATRPLSATKLPGRRIRRLVTSGIFSPLYSKGAILLLLIGSLLQGYANSTFDSIIVATILFILGSAISITAFPGKSAEIRIFLVTYSVYVFVGGIVQCYSLTTFGSPQSTFDAVYAFLPNISSQPPFATMATLPPNFNSPLAVLVWQQVYKVTWWMGLDFGIYSGVMFNAFMMGLSGSITVRTAREVFKNDSFRLYRVGLLYALCGLFILFGTILIRDCFTTFVNVLVLWGIVRWLVSPSFVNLLFAILLNGVSIYAMVYLRSEVAMLFVFYWSLALMLWFWSARPNLTRIFAGLLIFVILIITLSSLQNFFSTSHHFQKVSMSQYSTFAESHAKDDSLGMRLVVNQPTYIRLVLGTGSLLISPIPLWAFFREGATEYHLIKGYHGLYQVLVLPLVFTGILIVFKLLIRKDKRVVPILFISFYLIFSLLIVVATSLEQRHLAQFFPALVIMAALPDTRKIKTKKKLRKIASGWFAIVFLVHLAWSVIMIG